MSQETARNTSRCFVGTVGYTLRGRTVLAVGSNDVYYLPRPSGQPACTHQCFPYLSPFPCAIEVTAARIKSSLLKVPLRCSIQHGLDWLPNKQTPDNLQTSVVTLDFKFGGSMLGATRIVHVPLKQFSPMSSRGHYWRKSCVDLSCWVTAQF